MQVSNPISAQAQEHARLISSAPARIAQRAKFAHNADNPAGTKMRRVLPGKNSQHRPAMVRQLSVVGTNHTVGVGKPDEAQPANQHDLSENRITVNEERKQTANNRRFD
jgi:hypothetical protein